MTCTLPNILNYIMILFYTNPKWKKTGTFAHFPEVEIWSWAFYSWLCVSKCAESHKNQDFYGVARVRYCALAKSATNSSTNPCSYVKRHVQFIPTFLLNFHINSFHDSQFVITPIHIIWSKKVITSNSPVPRSLLVRECWNKMVEFMPLIWNIIVLQFAPAESRSDFYRHTNIELHCSFHVVFHKSGYFCYLIGRDLIDQFIMKLENQECPNYTGYLVVLSLIFT